MLGAQPSTRSHVVVGEHPAAGELPISSTLSGGEAPEDGDGHFVMILEGVVVAPR